MISFPIYLDNHSTTRVDPRVLEAMLPYFSEDYGNAASRSHRFGWTAEAAVEYARNQIANLVGAAKTEIFFTSGATESINLALKGAVEGYSQKGNRIISVQTEHKAGIDTLRSLEKKGFDIFYLKTDVTGLIDHEELKDSIDDKTILVSIMTANNEIGTIQDVKAIGNICSEKKVLFHTDASQAAGKIPIDVIADKIDILSFTAHKIYGPKGIGAIFIRNKFPKIKIIPQIEGGGHERGFRSGTLNVPAIVGFGKACDIIINEMPDEAERLRLLRNRLQDGLTENLSDVYVNGHPEKRLYNNLNISFGGLESDALMMSIKEIAVSSGSACSSASVHPSHVLKAIGLPENLVKSSIRFGVGRFNTEEEIDYVIGKVVEKVNYLRDISPSYSKSKGIHA